MRRLYHRSHRAHVTLGVAVAIALAAAGCGGESGPGGREATVRPGSATPIDVTFVDTKGPLPDKSDCTSRPGVCEVYYHGSGTISGDATGTAEYVGHSHYQPDGSLVYSQVVHPVETKGPCGGPDTFKFTEDNVLSPLDPKQLGLAGIGSWKIATHSGTGALRSATGSGYIVVVLHDGVRARFLGTISCRR